MTDIGPFQFTVVRARFGAASSGYEAPSGEADRLLAYLRGRGAVIRAAEDIPGALASMPDEDELSAYVCEEGIAVSHASDGWWLLFRDSEPLSGANEGASKREASGC